MVPGCRNAYEGNDCGFCPERYDGQTCDGCKDGYFGYPDCKPCGQCNVQNINNTIYYCDKNTGACGHYGEGQQQYEVNLKVFNDTGHTVRKICRGTVLDQNRVMTSASCLEKNKYLLDPNRDDKHLHFRIDFGNGIRRDITYFVSHPGYHYEKVQTM